ncbi:Daunorubicin/doxorubicin resistance ATP-binding protein DrrA [Dermatophilus congolensis]|uniref:Daunorubicin/doxorubicin resistance ATP-binding protein DrrA n=1 Tax=Dermatophilus congolensis TaxID=1863 RepID=A0A239VJ52_9MICO|nr:ABC transporter ATP-binding protein [Dermatophilus congolensis]SNV21624.1 Daunorubicin/doxorubicin resistance ATP-binding protein DrrA [Dermatophilus congolensis]
MSSDLKVQPHADRAAGRYAQAAIRTHSLTKEYRGIPVVDRVSITVPEQSVYGFLGLNGAGKSTTMKMLLGLIRISCGQATVLGRDIRAGRAEILAATGSLIEGPSFYGHLTGAQNMEIVRRVRGARSDIYGLLAYLGLEKARDKKVREYSLGMKQRLGIAMALIAEPRLLILDEPTNGLDPAGIHEIREMIRRFPADHGLTVLMSSHILSEVQQVADNIGIIHRGRLVFEGPLEALRGASQLRLRTNNDSLAHAYLRANGAPLQPDSLTLPWLDDVTVATMVRDLLRQGIDVYRVEGYEETLEDVFLRITGEAQEGQW